MIQCKDQSIFRLYMQDLKSIQRLLYIRGDNLENVLCNLASMNKREYFLLLYIQSMGRKVKVYMGFLLVLLIWVLKFYGGK